jgi:hypothetical protein
MNDGLLASAGFNGKIKLWPKEATGEPQLLMHGRWAYFILCAGRIV